MFFSRASLSQYSSKRPWTTLTWSICVLLYTFYDLSVRAKSVAIETSKIPKVTFLFFRRHGYFHHLQLHMRRSSWFYHRLRLHHSSKISLIHGSVIPTEMIKASFLAILYSVCKRFFFSYKPNWHADRFISSKRKLWNKLWHGGGASRKY